MGQKSSNVDLIPTAEVARLLGVIPRRVQALVSEGRLTPALQVGRAFLFRRRDIEGFERRPTGRPPKPKG